MHPYRRVFTNCFEENPIWLLFPTPQSPLTEIAPHCTLMADQSESRIFFRIEPGLWARGANGPAGAGAYLLNSKGECIW